MCHRIFISVFFLTIAALCWGQYGPAILLDEIPPCFAFNAKDGVQKDAVTGQIHFVYRQKVNDTLDRIIFASPEWQSACTFIYVDSLNYPGNYNYDIMRGAPSLSIDGNQFKVAYNHAGVVKQAVSADNGMTWTVTDIENAFDAMPIIQTGDEDIAFITHLDELNSGSYQLFVNINMSTNNTVVAFAGRDVYHGAVRSNTDISLLQANGGPNDNWPTFYAPVITSGVIQSMSGTPPYASVFRAGYCEHMPPLNPDYAQMRAQILNTGNLVGPSVPDENRIIFVTVNGEYYTAMQSIFVQNGWDTLAVYSDYPPGNGGVLFHNIIPHTDTLWVPFEGSTSANLTQIVNSTLWIKGQFTGKQTWYSPFDIKLVDDITLSTVPMGAEIPETCQDYVALVSDRQILIQYGYKDPVDSVRCKPNCDGDSLGIFIYAALYALSEGESGIPQDDGCFTFEYQHPHPSTPAYNLNSIVYDKIDLHRRPYPQTGTNPWPGYIDLPYYNPLWPESSPYLKRGTMHHYGSVTQQRKGYISRSYGDSDYPNPSGAWDIPLDYCGVASSAIVTDSILGITMAAVNAPNAIGIGVGYKKDYHFDNRLRSDTFSFNPFGLGIKLKSSHNGSNWITAYYKSLNDSLYSKSMYRFWGGNMLQLNNRLFYKATVTSPYIELHPPLADNEKIEFVDSFYGYIGVYQNNSAEPDSFKLLFYNPQLNMFHAYYSTSAAGRLNSDVRDFWVPTGVTLQPDGQFKIEYIYSGDNGSSPITVNWNPQIATLTAQQFDENRSRISTIMTGYGDASMLMFVAAPDSTNGHLYLGHFQIPIVANEDNVAPPVEFSTRTYPNPFSQSLTFQVKTNQSVPADIAIYNLKGQKVRTLATDHLLSKGTNDFTWDGLDSSGTPTASGIYFLRSSIAGKAKVTKLLKVR